MVIVRGHVGGEIQRLRDGEPLVELDVGQDGPASDIKNQDGFLDATDDEVAERIADGTYIVADLDEWFTNL